MLTKKLQQTKDFLDAQLLVVYKNDFIKDDPIQIPHLFSRKEDIEIAGFFAAVLAWGQRTTIINNCKKLIEYFDHAPFDFITNHEEQDLRKLEHFVHRTFNSTDLLYFIYALKHIYTQHGGLEKAMSAGMNNKSKTIETGLNQFKKLFFSLEDFPQRTMKHIASPEQNSACKRLNMYMRWMVRENKAGIDFGIWESISPSQLMCPLDIHSGTTARQLGLLKRPTDDWKAVLELMETLRLFNPQDPTLYDFALYGTGVLNKNLKRT
ncbi:MAG: TIGR02757 family protein [Bacteroidetes bacterium]|nr:TIGR02757 family protein [Bacteroidota bacterium]